MSPTVMRIGGFEFGWFAGDAGEPVHVHVFRGSNRSSSAKFWLRRHGVEMDHNKAQFTSGELRKIEKILSVNRDLLVARWHDFFLDGE